MAPRRRATELDEARIRAWFVEPIGSINEPVTFVQIPGDPTVQIIVSDLQNARTILREASQQTGTVLVEIDGVDGLATTDPFWDGKPTFVCSNPRCGKVHDVHLMAAENLFADSKGRRRR